MKKKENTKNFISFNQAFRILLLINLVMLRVVSLIFKLKSNKNIFLKVD